MRILHVLDHSAPLQSGYTYRTLSILRHQRRLGWETAQVTGEKHASEVSEEEAEGFRFYRTPKASAAWASLPVLRQAGVVQSLEQRLHELLPVVSPDLVHAHSPCLNGLAALRAASRRGLPVVYEVRAFWEDAAVDHGTNREGGPRYRLTRALETYVLKRAAAVTTICQGLKDDIVARGVSSEKVTVIPNAVDLERFETGQPPDLELRDRLGLSGAEVVGFLGSFYAYEGLSLLLRALASLSTSRPGLRALLVGGGPEEERLKREASELEIAERVVFTGRVPNQEIRRYYDLVDVLVYPRMRMRLTDTVTPLKPLEAMAMGKVVVASDVGGHRELMKDGETGLLFEAGRADALARRLETALSDPELRARLAESGRSFVERERTWIRSVDRYRSVYAALHEPARV